jgi:iron complex outermembrane receptor protein
VVRLRSRVAIPRPLRRAGFFVVPLLVTCALSGSAIAASLQGRILDSKSLESLPGVVLRVVPATGGSPLHGMSDTLGHFHFGPLPSGPLTVEARSLGHHPETQTLILTDSTSHLDLQLVPLPLIMGEVLVQARHVGRAHTGAFVEHLQVSAAGPGADLPQILEQASGVDIRRYGGLGAFSSLSIRGSTAAQVLIFLDGVALNQAVGGGVDLGSLPTGGIVSVDVYRGAVPSRFGGNSLGGVVHMRTRAPGGPPRAHLQLQAGAFQTRQVSASLSGQRHSWEGLALLHLSQSDNDFSFLDDNGTEYNTQDDEWTARRNSDFGALRVLLRAARHVATTRLQLSHTQDVSHRGMPGIGNFQALTTRLDRRLGITEVNLSGPLREGRAGYRIKLFHSAERTHYKDPLGEVGVGIQQDRNTTTASGFRTEGNVLQGPLLLTLFGGLRHERFSPENLQLSNAPSPSSNRLGLSAGSEVEASALTKRLLVNIGWQLEHLADDFALSDRRHDETLWNSRIGLSVDIGAGWTAQAHAGRYGRAPGFFELFGDRGAVLGNTDLVSESGRNLDAGVIFRAGRIGTGVQLAEIVVYRNEVGDLIRFVQNSQRVSTPHNIGHARMRGVETRLQFRLSPHLQVSSNYARQASENRSPFSFEHGNDLPNAPAHRLRSRVGVDAGSLSLHYEVSHESRHFLDRANLRPVPARTVHTTGARWAATRSTTLAVELRNLTDNQVADLWGYPLPGRAAFFSLDINLSPSSSESK